MTYIIIGCLAILAILLLFRLLTLISKRRNRLTAAQVADRIEAHIQGTEGPYDWDHFISVPIADDRLDAIRLQSSELEGRKDELERIVRHLRRRTADSSEAD